MKIQGIYNPALTVSLYNIIATPPSHIIYNSKPKKLQQVKFRQS